MAGSDLRSRYEGAVLGLRARVVAMRDEGRSLEMIARAVHAERTRLAAVFKELTPEPLRSRIHGPAIESLQFSGQELGRHHRQRDRPWPLDLVRWRWLITPVSCQRSAFVRSFTSTKGNHVSMVRQQIGSAAIAREDNRPWISGRRFRRAGGQRAFARRHAELPLAGIRRLGGARPGEAAAYRRQQGAGAGVAALGRVLGSGFRQTMSYLMVLE